MWSVLKRPMVLASGLLVFNGVTARAATVEVKVATQYRLSSVWESGSDGRAIVDR
jgi:hypothetical protein